MRVLGERVLIKAINQQEHETASGLYTVEHHAPEVIGTVMEVGDGVCHADFAVGNMVLFSPLAGQVMDHDGERFVVLEQDEILAVFDEQES